MITVKLAFPFLKSTRQIHRWLTLVEDTHQHSRSNKILTLWQADLYEVVLLATHIAYLIPCSRHLQSVTCSSSTMLVATTTLTHITLGLHSHHVLSTVSGSIQTGCIILQTTQRTYWVIECSLACKLDTCWNPTATVSILLLLRG